MIRRLALAFLLLCLLSFPALAEMPVPQLEARVTDLTATFSTDQKQVLEKQLAAFEARKGSQIAVLIVPTTQPEAIEQYSFRVVEQWKLGRKGVDDGVLLLVAKNDRALRIEVGYGLEGALNDATSKRIIEEFIVPRFKQGDFAGGVSAGVDRIITVVGGEPLPEPSARTSNGQAPHPTLLGLLWNNLLVVVFVFWIVGTVLRGMLGDFVGATVNGGLVGFLFWFLSASLFITLGAAIVAFILTLMEAGTGSGGGGYSGGGGGGFSSGGGFSGGGGGFGGGGASGRW